MVDNRRFASRVRTVAVTCVALTATGVLTGGAARASTTPPTFGPQVDVASGFAQPAGVAVDAAGDVYVADTSVNTVWKVPADGSPKTAVGSGFQLPMSVAVDADGTVYVADYGHNRVERIAASGAQSTAVDQLSAPSGVAVDAAGNVFIADTGGHDVLELHTTSNTVTTIASGITLPTGVAVDAAGAVYVVDASSSGNSVTRYVAGQPPEVLPIPGLQNPYAAAFDAQGNLFVANSGADNVLMVTPTGTTSPVGGGYHYPTGVTTNATGDVIVADTYTPRVTLNPSVDPQSITLTRAIPARTAPGTTALLAATGGGSGHPVVFTVDPGTYPSDACSIKASGPRVRFTKVGTCVLDIDQAGSLHYGSAHRTISVTIRPNGLASLAVQALSSSPVVGSSAAVAVHGFDAQGNDLGDVTTITTMSVNRGSCFHGTCDWDTAGPSIIRASVESIRATLPVTVALGITLVTGGAPVASFPATVGTPIDARIDPVGGGTGTYVFGRTAGSMPPGVALGPDGTFTGTPRRAGSYPITIVVKDSSNTGQRATVTTMITVSPATP